MNLPTELQQKMTELQKAMDVLAACKTNEELLVATKEANRLAFHCTSLQRQMIREITGEPVLLH